MALREACIKYCHWLHCSDILIITHRTTTELPHRVTIRLFLAELNLHFYKHGRFWGDIKF